jgi:hypothetical protein
MYRAGALRSLLLLLNTGCRNSCRVYALLLRFTPTPGM